MREISAEAAFAALREDARAVLCDVRTQNEWRSIGVPDLAGLGRQPVFLEWVSGPGLPPNPDFLARLQAAGAAKDAPVYFLCRSGVRSAAAALAADAAGWTHTVNIVGGFEAPGGWRASLLPTRPWRPE